MKVSAMRCFSNLKSNLVLLLSFLSVTVLTIEMEIGMRILFLLMFGFLFVGSLFHPCCIPLSTKIFRNGAAAALAASAEFVLFLHFSRHFEHHILYTLAYLSGLEVHWLTMGLGLLLCIIGFYAAYALSSKLLSVLTPFKKIILSYKKPLLILSLIFCVSLIGIIRADFNYVDDMGRIHYGYSLTGSFSRYISTFLSTFLHSNARLSDISPVPQLVAACILAFAAIFLYAAVTDNRELNAWGMIALIPVGVFPFFLSCYSYKFDAPYMAFSVLAAVAPLVYRKEHYAKFATAVSVCTILLCTTYQASSGIFPLVTLAICLQMWNRKEPFRKILSFLRPAVVGYVVGMLVFRIFLMAGNDSSYVDTSISLDALTKNIYKYILFSFRWFAPLWTLLLVLIAGFYVWVVVCASQQNKFLAFIVASASTLLMFVLSFGAYLILANPLFRSHAMYGLGLALAVCCIEISVAEKHSIGKAAVFLLSFCFFIFSFIYGNTLKMQKEYTTLRLNQLISDIKNLEIVRNDRPIPIQINGSIGYPQHLYGTFRDYPLLPEMVSIQLENSASYWGEYELLHYSGLNHVLVRHEGDDLSSYDLPVLVDNVYHTIRGNEGYIFVELKWAPHNQHSIYDKGSSAAGMEDPIP